MIDAADPFPHLRSSRPFMGYSVSILVSLHIFLGTREVCFLYEKKWKYRSTDFEIISHQPRFVTTCLSIGNWLTWKDSWLFAFGKQVLHWWLANVALQRCFTLVHIQYVQVQLVVVDVCYSYMSVCTDKTYSKLLLYHFYCVEYTVIHLSYANIPNK